MTWWMILGGGAVSTVVLSFWGWLAVRVIAQGYKLVELEARINARDVMCSERLEWLREMDSKLDKVADDTSAIRVALGEPPHV